MAIHGNKSQNARQNALNAFKKGEIVGSDDFCLRKPAGGLSWEDRHDLVGKELGRDVELGELINLDCFRLKDL